MNITAKEERWHRHFIGMALYHARMSKDPNTQVGAVIVGPDREILSAGFNGFPRGIQDTAERLNDRDEKLRLIVHAEMNALLAAARTGMRLKDCTLYMAAKDENGIWGGPPCTRCTVEMIQVGIKQVVSLPFKNTPSNWVDDLDKAGGLLEEAGIELVQVDAGIDLLCMFTTKQVNL